MAIINLPVVQPGERTNPEGKPARNKILLSVPDIEYRLIRPHLKFLSLPHHLSLHEPHGTSEFVHFPNEGLISLVVELNEGNSVEVGLVGNEGATGMPAILGLSASPLREGRANCGQWIQGESRHIGGNFAIYSTASSNLEPLCRGLDDASCANSRM
jgi:hypothetical protein